MSTLLYVFSLMYTVYIRNIDNLDSRSQDIKSTEDKSSMTSRCTLKINMNKSKLLSVFLHRIYTSDFIFRLKEKELKENAQKKERQQVFLQRFQEDMNTFQSTGFLEGE